MEGGAERERESERDRFLSSLPLAHAYEHMAGLCLPLHLRGEIFYCERLDKLANFMVEVKPTLMTAVPRLYELLYGRITAQVAKGSAFKLRAPESPNDSRVTPGKVTCLIQPSLYNPFCRLQPPDSEQVECPIATMMH